MSLIAPDAALVAYVPAPHAGFLKLFRKYAGKDLYILGQEFINEYKPLMRHLPGVTPGESATMVRALEIFKSVRILTKEAVPGLRGRRIIMPDDDVMRLIARKDFADMPVEFDGSWKLRWDWGQTQKKLIPDGRSITCGEFEREVMSQALALAGRSSDWWRQIGAVLTKNGRVLLAAFNKHLPNEHTAYLYGDPRSNFEPGEFVEMSVSGHAEVLLLAMAACRGISTKDCELYSSTFPCPPCANPISYSGIRALYYAEGYAVLNAADALDAKGIEIIRVDMTAPAP